MRQELKILISVAVTAGLQSPTFPTPSIGVSRHLLSADQAAGIFPMEALAPHALSTPLFGHPPSPTFGGQLREVQNLPHDNPRHDPSGHAYIRPELLARFPLKEDQPRYVPAPVDAALARTLIDLIGSSGYFGTLAHLRTTSPEAYQDLVHLLTAFYNENHGFNYYRAGDVIVGPGLDYPGNGKIHFVVDGEARLMTYTANGGEPHIELFTGDVDFKPGMSFGEWAVARELIEHTGHVQTRHGVRTFTLTTEQYARLNLLLIRHKVSVVRQKAAPFLAHFTDEERDAILSPYPNMGLFRLRREAETTETDKVSPHSREQQAAYNELRGFDFVYLNEEGQWQAVDSAVHSAIQRVSDNLNYLTGNTPIPGPNLVQSGAYGMMSSEALRALAQSMEPLTPSTHAHKPLILDHPRENIYFIDPTQHAAGTTAKKVGIHVVFRDLRHPEHTKKISFPLPPDGVIDSVRLLAQWTQLASAKESRPTKHGWEVSQIQAVLPPGTTLHKASSNDYQAVLDHSVTYSVSQKLQAIRTEGFDLSEAQERHLQDLINEHLKAGASPWEQALRLGHCDLNQTMRLELFELLKN